jgi:hypothetical protein
MREISRLRDKAEELKTLGDWHTVRTYATDRRLMEASNHFSSSPIVLHPS